MIRHVVVVLVLAACKRDATPPPTPAAGSALDHLMESPAPIDAAVARDPALAALFESGLKCTWNAGNVASCPEPEKIHKLAFDRQSDRDLAANCAAALRDPAPTTRRLAAECMRGFNDATRTPFLGAGLDAFEAEHDPATRAAISFAFGSGNARQAGVEPRVIALIRGLEAHGDDDNAGNFLDSMFPQYLMQTTAPPSKPAGDLALELARNSGRHTQTRALEDIGLLVDRMADVCSALGAALATEQWAGAVETLSKFPSGCPDEREPAAVVVNVHMRKGTYDPAMRLLVKRLPLTPAQVEKMRAACKVLVAKAPDWQRDDAKQLLKLLDPYQAPK